MMDWLPPQIWLLLITLTIIAAFVLPAAKLSGAIHWPAAVCLIPTFVLVILAFIALDGWNELMRDGWH